MYSYLFSVPSCSSDESFEFTLEGNFYPTKDYICNYLYGELNNSSISKYNEIMSVIDVIRNDYPSRIGMNVVTHTQQVGMRGSGHSTMSVRRR